MRTVEILAALTAAALTVPAVAADKASDASASQTASAKETKYCIEYEVPTGSKRAPKACLTKAQWAKRGVNVDDLTKKK